jgi:hypothetical protein
VASLQHCQVPGATCSDSLWIQDYGVSWGLENARAEIRHPTTSPADKQVPTDTYRIHMPAPNSYTHMPRSGPHSCGTHRPMELTLSLIHCLRKFAMYKHSAVQPDPRLEGHKDTPTPTQILATPKPQTLIVTDTQPGTPTKPRPLAVLFLDQPRCPR